MRLLPHALLTAFVLVMAPAMALAGQASIGTAASGYDVVAYQTESAAVPGTTDHFVLHEGVAYLFSSAANKALFEADPAKYAPAYGGYCAMGMAMGKKFPVDPNAWAVVNDTLYLNLSKDVQNAWKSDIPGNIAKADKNWAALAK